jgi:chromosome segregation ATPase
MHQHTYENHDTINSTCRFQHASKVGDVRQLVERFEIRETSGPRARELQHAQLALERATKRKQKLTEIIVARSKEFAEAQSSLQGTSKDNQQKKSKELAKRKDRLDEAKYTLREVDSQSQSASKLIEDLRLPLQEERINSVAKFSSRTKP